MSSDKLIGRAHYLQGIKLSDKEDLNGAVVSFKNALEQAYAVPGLYFELASGLWHLGKDEEAKQYLLEGLKLFPNEGPYYWLLGQIDFDHNDFENAIHNFSHAIRLEKDSNECAHAYQWRGDSYKQLGRYEEAISDFSQAISIDPNYIEAYYFRAECYEEKGQYDAALSDWENILSREPYFEPAYFAKACFDRQQERHERAIQNFSQALLISRDANSYTLRGLSFQSLGRLNEALKDFNKAIQLNPKNGDFYRIRALCFIRLGQAHKAKIDLDRAIALEAE